MRPTPIRSHIQTDEQQVNPLHQVTLQEPHRVAAAPLQSAVDGYNRRFYERCWSFATLLPMAGVQLPARIHGLDVEIGCGLRPRLPFDSALFVDVSPTACRKLRAAGARAVRASIDALPFADRSVSGLYLFDVLEHVENDLQVSRELARVSRTDGRLVVSTPLHGDRWHEFDRVVGHARRYEPQALLDLFRSQGFELEACASFGLRPSNSWLTRVGAYYMEHRPRKAFFLQELTLRLTRRWAQTTQLLPITAADFLAQAANADSVVTAWRRR